MQEWIPLQQTFLFELLSMEAPPAPLACHSCGITDGSFHRCLDCFSRHVFCRQCCVTMHAYHPFHIIDVWTGTHFSRTTLHALGYILHLGHGGDRCPAAGDWDYEPMAGQSPRDVDVVDYSEDEDLVLVSTNGVHKHSVRWCACRHCPEPSMQLFNMGLYPASMSHPATAFTFQMLDYFHTDAMECRTSASNYFNKLRRLTNESFPDTVPVSAAIYCNSNRSISFPG